MVEIKNDISFFKDTISMAAIGQLPSDDFTFADKLMQRVLLDTRVGSKTVNLNT